MKPFDRVHFAYNAFMNRLNLYHPDEIMKLLKLNKNEIVIDFGGGTGYLATKYSEKAKTVYVVDESSKMLSHIPEKENIIPVHKNILDSGFPDQFADTAVLTDVFHHIKDQNRLVSEIKRILKPGGRILIMDFDASHPKTKLLMIFEFILFGFLHFRSFQWYLNYFPNYFCIQKINNHGFYFFILFIKSSYIKQEESNHV